MWKLPNFNLFSCTCNAWRSIYIVQYCYVENEESQVIITTLETKLQEFKQQLLKTTGWNVTIQYFIYHNYITSDISSYLPKLAVELVVVLETVKEDWEQPGLQLIKDQSILTDVKSEGNCSEQMMFLLKEWSEKEGTLTELDTLHNLVKKEVIPGMLYITVNLNCYISVDQDIISLVIFYCQIYMLYKRKRVLLLTLVNRSLPSSMINQVTYILYIIVIYKPVFCKGDTNKYMTTYVLITLYSVITNYFLIEYNRCFYYFIMWLIYTIW